MIVKEIETKDLIIRFITDENCESPRSWDNIGKMVCWHDRYRLGDEHDFKNPEEFIDYLYETYCGKNKVKNKIEEIKKHVVILPLYLYDHSGLTISTTPFTCRWDSGQVGYIYASKDRFIKETGYTEKDLFENGVAEELLNGEVEVYDIYLRGEVYGCQILKKKICDCCGHAELEEIDNCWGFFGGDITKNGMLEYIPEEYYPLLGDIRYIQ